MSHDGTHHKISTNDITVITSDYPIAGSLWLTGGIPIERSDSQPLEVRNRVTLCNCGHSRINPLCDGGHRHKQNAQGESVLINLTAIKLKKSPSFTTLISVYIIQFT